MRAFVIDRYGGPEQLVERDLPRPSPRPRDLVVAVHASSINPLDFKIREGKLKRVTRYRFPLVLGCDLSGTVVEVGAEVTRFKVGDAVFARLQKDRIGAFAELALVEETAAAIKPATISHIEAAALPLAVLTAWQALVDVAALRPGQRVLIHAGAGGVGSLAIQIARHLGAHVTTTTSAANEPLVRTLGAHVVIDYRSTRFETIPGSYDAVFDTQGGDTLRRSFDVIAPGGTVVTIGGLPTARAARDRGASITTMVLLKAMNAGIERRARARRARFEYLFMRPDGAQLAQIADLVDRGVVVPVIDRVLPLEQIHEGFAHVESGHARGKVVLEVRG